jgi:hypothetical protein
MPENLRWKKYFRKVPWSKFPLFQYVCSYCLTVKLLGQALKFVITRRVNRINVFKYLGNPPLLQQFAVQSPGKFVCLLYVVVEALCYKSEGLGFETR